MKQLFAYAGIVAAFAAAAFAFAGNASFAGSLAAFAGVSMTTSLLVKGQRDD